MADDIAEKRVYGDRTGAATVLVAAAPGVAAVAVSGDRVGGTELLVACSPRGIAADGDRTVVATDEAVLRLGAGEVTSLGFGPAVAVGVHEGVIAAGPDGRIARHADGGWAPLGTLADVTAIDGPFVATDAGLHRLADGLPGVGLDAVRDVVARPRPLAATAGGLYALANGWDRRLDGDFRTVAAGGALAHAATAETLYARTDREWAPAALPVEERVADVAYPDGPCVVTADGTALLPVEDGWRPYPLGLPGVVGAVATENAFEPPA